MGRCCALRAVPGQVHVEAEARAEQRFEPRPTWVSASWTCSRAFGSPSHISDPQSSSLSTAPPSSGPGRGRQPAGGETEAGSARLLPQRPTNLEWLAGVRLHHKGPPSSSAPSPPALSWPPDFPSCATSLLPAFPGAGSGLAPAMNALSVGSVCVHTCTCQAHAKYFILVNLFNLPHTLEVGTIIIPVSQVKKLRTEP